MPRMNRLEMKASLQAWKDEEFFGLAPREYRHLVNTWKSLTRFQSQKVKNPRYIEEFVDDLPRFATWSLANGFSLDKELELLRPTVVPGTRLIFSWDDVWNGNATKSFRTYNLYMEGDVEESTDTPVQVKEEHWIKVFESMQWVTQTALKRRKRKPILTSYGVKRLKLSRAPKKATCFGETKSLAAWAKDSRCQVTDKTLRARLEDGWTPEEAIIQRRGTMPDRLKRCS